MESIILSSGRSNITNGQIDRIIEHLTILRCLLEAKPKRSENIDRRISYVKEDIITLRELF